MVNCKRCWCLCWDCSSSCDRQNGVLNLKRERAGEREGTCGGWARSAGVVAERTCLDLFRLGAFAVSAAMRALVLLALSCCCFHPFGEIWICLVLLFYCPRAQQSICTGLSWARQLPERPCSAWAGRLPWCAVLCISVLHAFAPYLLRAIARLCVVYCAGVCVCSVRFLQPEAAA